MSTATAPTVIRGLVYVSLWAARRWFHTDPYASDPYTAERMPS